MNILFFSRKFFPSIGGVEKHTWEVAVRLAKVGHEVTVVSEDDEGGEQSPTSSAKGYNTYDLVFLTGQTHRKKSEKNRKKTNKTTGSLVSIKIPVSGIERRKKWQIWFLLLQNQKLISLADIIHCHDVFFWYLPFRFLYPGKPVYTTFHGYETVFPPKRKVIRTRKLSAALSRGSINVGDYIEKWYGTKSTYVTYGGIDKMQNAKIKMQNDNTKLKILFVGRLEEDTGVRTYLKALELLKKKRVPFEFEACGDGTLRNVAEKFGKVHGFVPDLSPYLEGASIVFTSSYLSILEAFAAKKLVFATYNNPLKEDYLKMTPFSKYLVIEQSLEKLVERIMFYKIDTNEQDELVANAHIWVQDKTWDKVVELYLKLWQKT